jgi:hypothetical protein
VEKQCVRPEIRGAAFFCPPSVDSFPFSTPLSTAENFTALSLFSLAMVAILGHELLEIIS